MNYRRIVRRATHASRSVPSVIMAMIVVVLAGWAVTEIVLHVLGRNALLYPAASAWQILLDPTGIPRSYALIGGGIAAFVGILAMTLSIKPGRLSKHQRSNELGAVIVDDSLIASFAAHELARFAQLPDSHVDVVLWRRQVQANLIPLSGLRIAAAQLENHLQNTLDHSGLQPRLAARVQVAETGKVGL